MPTAYAPPPGVEDLYNNAPPEDQQPPADQGDDEKRENQDEGQTGVLPKSFFGSKELKPGNRCEIEIDRILDGEVQFHYVPHDQKDDIAEERSRGEMADSGGAPEAPAAPGMFD